MKKWSARLSGVGLAVLMGSAALAGPQDGTLTIAVSGPLEPVDVYMGPGPEVSMTASGVFNTLVEFDADQKVYNGVIADSWTQIDPNTVEFKLKSGLTFQDGSALDAEDVAYTINFLANPDTKFRLKTRYELLAGAEKVDDLTVRIMTKVPYPLLMPRLIGMPIFPSDSHAALGADYANWGRAPIGSGPYKVVSFDESTGIVMERWDDYKLGPLPDFKRVVFKPLPDAQTQMAEMMVGSVDIIIARSPDQITALTANPNIEATAIEDMFFQYISLDAIGRSGFEPFKDLRVRQAVAHAIDRNAIRTAIVSGGKDAADLNRLCFPFQVGCPDGGEVPAYDPEKAKALLAEAGYAEGFDLQISTWGPSRAVADAVAGYLRAVGIRANIDMLTISAYRKKQVDGELQALVSNYSYGGLPDAGTVGDFFFVSPDRDYYGNARLTELSKEVNKTLDEGARNEMFSEAFGIMESEIYVLPIAKDPFVLIHSKDVSVDTATRKNILFAQPNLLRAEGNVPAILGWKK